MEQALRSKLAQTESLKAQLEVAVADVQTEMSACLALRGSLEDRLRRVLQKQDLNQGRLGVSAGATAVGCACMCACIVAHIPSVHEEEAGADRLGRA